MQNKPETTPSTKPLVAPEKKDNQENPNQQKEAALKKKESGKEKTKKETKGKLDTLLGGDFGLLMKKLFKTFGSFLASFDGIKDKVGNIFAAQSPEDVDKIFRESKNYKVPTIANPNDKKTEILEPNADEKLISYLYRCLKIPIPTKEQIAPKKTLNIRHLISQLWRTYQFEKGEKAIMKGFTQKPEKFYKDDIIFFRNGLTGKITAGFAQEIHEHTVIVTTLDETGTKRTIPMYKNMCFMAFHIPGNKPKGSVPIKKKKKSGYEFDSK